MQKIIAATMVVLGSVSDARLSHIGAPAGSRSMTDLEAPIGQNTSDAD